MSRQEDDLLWRNIPNPNIWSFPPTLRPTNMNTHHTNERPHYIGLILSSYHLISQTRRFNRSLVFVRVGLFGSVGLGWTRATCRG